MKRVQYSCASCGCSGLGRRSAPREGGCVLCVAMLALSACAPAGSDSGGKRRLSIATGGTGGVFYPYGGGIAKIITDSLPNVEATAEVTAASIDNLKFLKQGTSDLAFTMSDAAQDAVLARDEFKEFGAIPLRTLAVLYSSYTHLVTLDELRHHRRDRPQRARDLDGRRRFGHRHAGIPNPRSRRTRHDTRHPHAEPGRRPVGRCAEGRKDRRVLLERRPADGIGARPRQHAAHPRAVPLD